MGFVGYAGSVQGVHVIKTLAFLLSFYKKEVEKVSREGKEVEKVAMEGQEVEKVAREGKEV
jgi:hypothetical protein